MPNIPMWQAPTPTQTLQPQADSTMGNVPAQGSATQSYIDPHALAKALGGGQGTGMPDPMSGAPAGVNNPAGIQGGVNNISGAPQNSPSWFQQLSGYFGNFGGGQ